MINAQELLAKVEEAGNGVDAYRLKGDGWPPVDTIALSPAAYGLVFTGDSFTNKELGKFVNAQPDSPMLSFNNVAPEAAPEPLTATFDLTNNPGSTT